MLKLLTLQLHYKQEFMVNQDNTNTPIQAHISPLSYIIIALIVAIASSATLLMYVTYFAPQTTDNSQIIAANIKSLSTQLEEIDASVKLNAARVDLQDRLEPELVTEFVNDTEFLNNVASLKKKIIKRRLESEVIKLENEKIARDNNDNNSDYSKTNEETQTARNLFDILMINATNKTAVIQIQEDIIPVKVGDNVRGFDITNITNDNVVVVDSQGEREILTLNYLTKPIYDQDTTTGEENVQDETQ